MLVLVLALALLAGPAAAQIQSHNYNASAITGVLPAATGGTGVANWTKLSTAQLDKTSSTTLSSVPGLSISLLAGVTYHCRGALFSVIGAATGGIKFALSNGDTLTATRFRLGAFIPSVGGLQQSVLGTAMGGTNQTANVIVWDAVIAVNAAGTLVVQAAQNASDPATTSVL